MYFSFISYFYYITSDKSVISHLLLQKCAQLPVIKDYLSNLESSLMPPSISRAPDFSNQFAFPLEVIEIGILLYLPTEICWKAERELQKLRELQKSQFS